MIKPLLLLFLLSSIYSVTKDECSGQWTQTHEAYCSNSRNEKVTLAAFKEDCESGTCSESSLEIKSSCETKWVEGFCYSKLDNQIIKTITSEQMCMQTKGTWTLNYCVVFDFNENMYNSIKNKYNNEAYSKSKHFTEANCKLFDMTWEDDEDGQYCYFDTDNGIDIPNQYLCEAVGGTWSYNKKVCSVDMDSEACEKINGKNWGKCNLFTEEGYLKNKCDSINSYYWKNETCYDVPDYTKDKCREDNWLNGFCLIDGQMVTKKDECLAQNRKWTPDDSNDYVWNEADGECGDSIIIIKYFIFILGLLFCL